MIRNLLDFGTKSSDNTALIQAALNSGEIVYVPPGVYVVDAPLTYAASPTYKPFRMFGDSADLCKIVGTPNLGNRSLISRWDWHLIYTGVPNAPHQWISNGPLSPVEGATGVECWAKGIHFETQSQSNACFEAYNSAIMNYWEDCRFTYRFRGLTIVSAFNNVVRNCEFNQVGSRFWFNDTQRMANAWGLYDVGHAIIENCRFDNCVLGLFLNNTECTVDQLFFNKCIKGCVTYGLLAHPDLVNNLSAMTASSLTGLVFNECLRGLDISASTTRLIACWFKTAGSAPQLDGISSGSAEYAIFNQTNDTYSQFEYLHAEGTYSLGKVVGPNILPVVSLL